MAKPAGWGSVLALCMTMETTAAVADETNDAARRELAPTGALRVAVAVAPAPSAFWAVKNASEEPRGVSVVLGSALASRLGVPARFVVFRSSGEITDAAASGAWDVSFMPVDAARKGKVDFGPDYSLGESTFLVAPGSTIASIAEVDRPGVTVVGVENTTTIRTARRIVKNTRVMGATSVEEVVALVRAGQAEAVALGRDSLEMLEKQLPGSRVLPGHFHATGTAVAVPKDKPAALAYVTDFIEQAKRDGTVARAFAEHGIKAPVAPAGSKS